MNYKLPRTVIARRYSDLPAGRQARQSHFLSLRVNRLLFLLPVLALWPIQLFLKTRPSLATILSSVLIFLLSRYFFKKSKLSFAIIITVVLSLWFSGALSANSLSRYVFINKEKMFLESPAIPSTPLARIYLNKYSLFVGEYEHNFFNLLDPNRYFFGSHPRENPAEEVNFIKFPFISIFFILLAVFRVKDDTHIRYLLLSVLVLIFSLSFARDLSSVDFLLYPYISALIISGYVYSLRSKNLFLRLSPYILIPLSFAEYLLL